MHWNSHLVVEQLLGQSGTLIALPWLTRRPNSTKTHFMIDLSRRLQPKHVDRVLQCTKGSCILTNWLTASFVDQWNPAHD